MSAKAAPVITASNISAGCLALAISRDWKTTLSPTPRIIITIQRTRPTVRRSLCGSGAAAAKAA